MVVELAGKPVLSDLFNANTARGMKRSPQLDKVEPTTPLRLAVAAALAFPDGSMTASGLRRECARGRAE